MAKFKVVTRGDSDPHGKPRVYFTCHPDDFDKYFNKICRDIFKVREIDCAIYYTEDMTESLNGINYTVDLHQVRLFVVPITRKLLLEDNRAMRKDIEYAKENNIPILPFVMEPGLENIYALPSKFGERQFVDPNSTDVTEAKYEDKLKKYLESAIISNEIVSQIRKTFTTYVFLSYRKKDREMANRLMRMIHDIPVCRSVAIWYDEFLAVSDSFVQDIDEVMGKSNVFLMLITPRVLEDRNYIMTDEYPKAIDKGLNIIPVELEAVDHNELERKYPGLPPCIDPYNGTELYDAIMKALPGLKFSAKIPKTPEKNYLMGLAYLYGVDVEINIELATEFLTLAADGGLFKAMIMLYKMFYEGKYVNVDYSRAIKWMERIVEYCVREYGEYESITLTAQSNLAVAYDNLGDYSKALDLNEKIYKLRCEILGEDHPSTLTSLGNLSCTYANLGDNSKALELQEKVYLLRCEILGDKHPDTLSSLHNLAIAYGNLKDYSKAFELKEKAYVLRREVLGDEHPDTLMSLGNLAVAYSDLGDYTKAIELHEKVYALGCEVLGERHPDTLRYLGNLAYDYSKIGNHPKALELQEKVYALRCEILGDKHPYTITSLNNLASAYGELGDYSRYLELNEKVYALRYEVLGDEHPDTLDSLGNLACARCDVGDYDEALKLYEKLYEIRCRVQGEEHPNTVVEKKNIDLVKRFLADDEGRSDGIVELRRKTMELAQKTYLMNMILHGVDGAETIEALKNYAESSLKNGARRIALKLYENLYEMQCRILGEEHPDTLETKKILDTLRRITE